MSTVTWSARSTFPERAMLAVFGVTLLLSALLMFLLEPMAAKMVLPLLGGSPAVWNTCVVFFQAMLLAGYGYAHAGPALLGVRRHAILHGILVVAAVLVLPFSVVSTTPPADANPGLWLQGFLLATIGLPFFVLTTTAPLLQRWFAATDHPSAHDPYFLYAASNAGSLAGLILYPAVMEPLFRISEQAAAWSLAYRMFAALALGCALLLWRQHTSRERAVMEQLPRAADAITAARRLKWVALAFAPSSLMLAVTTFISTDIAAVPLMWIVPLALYLITFVIAFSSRRYPRAFIDRILPLYFLPLVLMLIMGVSGPFVVVIPVHLGAFFVSALVCHRELAEDRPGPSRLTEFYFWVALGGVLGSLFNTFVAPMVFTGVAEYPAVLVLVCLLRSMPMWEAPGTSRMSNLALAVAAGVLTAVIIGWGHRIESRVMLAALLTIPAFLCLRVSRTRVPFAIAIALMLSVALWQRDQFGTVLEAQRTFFGTYRVRTHPSGQYRSLFHGTTLHGMQSIAAERRAEPLTYYHPTGPFGDVFRSAPSTSTHAEAAVVGLGVGSLATYRREGQRWTFFEIDPAVEALARNTSFFTYLADCGTSCGVVLGDARLSLRNERDRQYGIIVLDAFSSDAIPVHLMTREAIELYLSRLAPGGVLAFHISNRHLNLEPVLARLSEELQLVSFICRERLANENAAAGKISSDWMVMARERADLGTLPNDPSRWQQAKIDEKVAPWTDDYSNILSVLGK